MLYFFFNLFLSILMVYIPLFFSFKIKWNSNKASMFECGFDPFFLVRIPFSIRFFKLCLIFIFFDIEIIITLPIILTILNHNLIFWTFFLILFVIFTSLILEWHQGSIDWSK